MTALAVRLGAYAAALALAFAGALTVGGAVEPVMTSTSGEEDVVDAPDGHGRGSAEPVTAAPAPPGLAVSESGYTLVPASSRLPRGERVPFRFTVTGPAGDPVTSYRETHEKDLHLIVVRRDLATFQHVHPTRTADDAWTVDLDLSAAGTYRVFADFAPAGTDSTLTLGTDVFVAGEFEPRPLPAPTATASVEGYTVHLAGKARPGTVSDLTLTVTRAGRPVTDLEPYLGAFGHLVALRSGDLAYLHTHPAEAATAGRRGGPDVRFGVEFPTAGTYRLFLDFQVGGRVRTASFTVEVAGSSVSVPTGTHSDAPSHGH